MASDAIRRFERFCAISPRIRWRTGSIAVSSYLVARPIWWDINLLYVADTTGHPDSGTANVGFTP